MYEVRPGNPLPLGANAGPEGVNFAIFSRHATAITLCIYRDSRDSEPEFSYTLDHRLNRTGDIWHCRLRGAGSGTLYLWRADGPYDPLAGLRFNHNKALVDPYARAMTDDFPMNHIAAYAYDPDSEMLDLSFSETRNDGTMPKAIVVADDFDWQGDRPLNYPLRNCILYETHVKGLTMHPSAGVANPGTYRGVVEMIPYFRELGVTSLEFLPVQEFDEFENFRHNPTTGERLRNYWGYSTIAFFAPKCSYSSDRSYGGQVGEFKYMVRELHKAGLEVILDIVFNHTAEGKELGPTINYRGLDNGMYYMLDEEKRYYKNYSGCGNTLNCNHPVLRSLIMDCLHYWVCDMHVDGFRFDLGSILGRDSTGKLLENPPVVERIAEDPLLRDTKIIAEAWDAGGAYQVGWFPGNRWAEWNDRFRDDVRKFWRGEPKSVTQLATRLTGSSDLYLRNDRKPFHSINFMTAHDGFTLNDLVSYSRKHNEANGENNHDGNDSNLSANHGIEGPSANPDIERLRNRQVKNFLATLLLSAGTPMILGGDELRRSQKGNNNAYCQNNEISWYDWTCLQKHADIHRFCARLIDFRKRHHALRRPDFFKGTDGDENAIPDITWYDETGGFPDWSAVDLRIAALIDGSRDDCCGEIDDNHVYMAFNASPEASVFVIPRLPDGKTWSRAIDTSLDSPEDCVEPGCEVTLEPLEAYRVESRSLVVLLSETEKRIAS
jgi:glycogen operon protein